MKITLLGNCQTKALSWYIRQLDSSFDVQWICIERFLDNWGPVIGFHGKRINVITDIQEAIKRLESSDYIIFQHIQTNVSENYNLNAIEKHAKNAKLISISSFFYEPNDPNQKMLEGMIERAEQFNIDIPAHKIIQKHGPKITTQTSNHPHVFYFLELVREICVKADWDYYSKEQHNQYLKEGYPFG